MPRPVLPLLIALGGLLASPVWATETVSYPVVRPMVMPAAAPVAEGATAETLVAAELAGLETIEVAGDTLRYLETEADGLIHRTASWTGNVRLIGGSLLLTTDALELTFIPQAKEAEADPSTEGPQIASLTAGPVVEIRVRQDLVVIRGESLAYAFQEQEGEVILPTIDILLPQEILESLGDLPLKIGDLQTTIHGEKVTLNDSDVTIERPEIALLTEGGRDLRLTAARVEVLNPHPDVTRLRTRNLRITLDSLTLIKLPWTQVFNVRGSIPSGGFDVDFPSFVSAEEGLGVTTSAQYVWDGGGKHPYVNTWSLGTRLETIFSDRSYVAPFVAFYDPELGTLRGTWGTTRGVSPIDDDSLPVYAAPELEWLGPRYELARWLSLRPEIGLGQIDERSSGREYDRARATLLWATSKFPLGHDRLTARLEGKVDQRFYETGYDQRIGEAGIVIQYVDPGSFGFEISYFRRDDTGFSPFLHDRVRLREEVSFREKAIGPDGWNGLLRGQYDIENDRWRHFELGVGKELEIIEARLLYDTINGQVRFELGYVGEI